MRKLGKAQIACLNVLERGGNVWQVGGLNAMHPAYEMIAPRGTSYDAPQISWKSLIALQERGLVKFESHPSHSWRDDFRITIQGKRFIRESRKN